jgi:hypothetical protein
MRTGACEYPSWGGARSTNRPDTFSQTIPPTALHLRQGGGSYILGQEQKSGAPQGDDVVHRIGAKSGSRYRLRAS